MILLHCFLYTKQPSIRTWNSKRSLFTSQWVLSARLSFYAPSSVPEIILLSLRIMVWSSSLDILSCTHLSVFLLLSFTINGRCSTIKMIPCLSLGSLHSCSIVLCLISYKWKLDHRTWGSEGIKEERRKDTRVKKSIWELYKLGWKGWIFFRRLFFWRTK